MYVLLLFFYGEGKIHFPDAALVSVIHRCDEVNFEGRQKLQFNLHPFDMRIVLLLLSSLVALVILLDCCEGRSTGGGTDAIIVVSSTDDFCYEYSNVKVISAARPGPRRSMIYSKRIREANSRVG